MPLQVQSREDVVAEDSKLERLMRWHRGETPGPWQISFYPTYRCNIRCKICWKQAFEEPIDRAEEIGSERMMKLVDEAADLGVREWIIGGGGELMLRSTAIMPMLERIRERGMNGIVQTNFTRFTEAQLERLVDMGWYSLNISLDGPTEAINDAIRDKNDYARVVANIRKIQEIKKARGSELPLINITSVVTNLNYNHLKGFIDLSREFAMSPGYLTLVDLIIFGENDKQFMLSDAQRAELPGLVREAIAYAEEQQVACGYVNFLGGLEKGEKADALDLFSTPEDTVSPKSMCFEPFYHMVILPDGLSGPCCTFYDAENANSVWSLGLKEVWLGPYMQESRRKLLQGTPMEYCKECMLTRIAANQHLQNEFADFAERAVAEEPLAIGNLVGRAARSLGKHGVAGTIKRGREWLDIRSRAKKETAAR
ncbi:MAG: radical SAM protein [Candidatus Hydrogenedens sp.]|nr:radical SAM protein [Candidatus Hydrogenedens sp.]